MAEATTGATGTPNNDAGGASTPTSVTGGDDKTAAPATDVNANQDKGQEGKKDAKTDSPAGDKPADKKEAEQPVIPEKYDLKLPEGVLVDEGLMKEFHTLGKENKWTNETAQKMADMHLKAIGLFVSKQDGEFTEQVNSWSKEIVDDPELGGAKVDATVAQARKVMALANTIPGLDAKRLTNDLNKTGLTTHPDVVRLFHYLGQFIGEDNKFIRGGTTTPETQDAATIMYGPNGVRERSKE